MECQPEVRKPCVIPKDSLYLLINEDRLSSEKKEIAKLFSWGIDLVIINDELSKILI